LLLNCGLQVIAVGRREAPLTALQKEAGGIGKVTSVVADVGTAAGREAVVAAASGIGKVDYLVQNAGTVEPIAKLADIDEAAWMQAFAVNVHAPVFLLKSLHKHLVVPGARVLHIGSGAATSAIGGWTAYCATKAAFKSIWKSLSIELKPQGVLVGSVRPGIVNTPMQAVIRAAPADAMPDVETFRGFYSKAGAAIASATPVVGKAPPAGALDTAENCAAFLQFLLQTTADDEFVADEWDIREPSHHARWTE
jgi:NAD(P)-dependent dehydrogenase (short-subunit alcohol dehydrogenase family)